MKSVSAVILLVLALFIPARVLAEEKWSKEDTYRQVAVTVLLVADWSQTRYMARNPCARAGGVSTCADPFREDGFARPFIGSRPSVGKVNSYFVASIIGHAAISYVLPPPWRDIWQYIEIGIEVGTVRRNYIGIQYGF